MSRCLQGEKSAMRRNDGERRMDRGVSIDSLGDNRVLGSFKLQAGTRDGSGPQVRRVRLRDE